MMLAITSVQTIEKVMGAGGLSRVRVGSARRAGGVVARVRAALRPGLGAAGGDMPAVRTLLLALALAACATTPTPRGVAQDFAACFEGWPRSATHERDWPLSARCPCLRDADAACLRRSEEHTS